MTLKELLGEAYKEGLTIEEIEAELGGKNLVDADTLPKSVKKDQFDRVASDLATYKRQVKELQEKNMTDDEKIKAQLQQAEDVKTQYMKELSKLKAQEVFVKSGLSEAEYSKVIDMVIGDDSEMTISRAKDLVTLISSQKETAKKTVEIDLMKNVPKPGNNSSTSNAPTLDVFKEMSWLERTELKQNDAEMFTQLSAQEDGGK